MSSRVHPVDPADPALTPSDGGESRAIKSTASAVVDDPAVFRLLKPGDANSQSLVKVWGKKKRVCANALFIFPIQGAFRQKVLILAEWVWFDRFILFLILLNGILLSLYQWRDPDDEGYNWVVNKVADPILTAFFTFELLVKVISWGFFLDKGSYLRDAWNWLDIVVVVSALVAYIPNGDIIGLNFLRVFRVLRPLRSLNKMPQMKILVNTVLSSIPRLGNVSVMAAFLFFVIAIIGITLMDGIFYHRCRETAEPVLDVARGCWAWNYTEDERLCGGHYMCEDTGGFCRGHEKDRQDELRPSFPGGKQGKPWCEFSEPSKWGKQGGEDVDGLGFAETDFIHFDHVFGALLVVFQSMTVEGWTDIMYNVQDAYSLWIGTIYFFMLVFITWCFLLNIALAVIDEARSDFQAEEDEKETEKAIQEVPEGSVEGGSQASQQPDEPLWLDNGVVFALNFVATSEVFMNFIMFVIVANVITMMIEAKYPPDLHLTDAIQYCEIIFLVIFCIEMAIMLGGHGPKTYWTNPVTAFDGVIVLASVTSKIMGGAGPFTALRVLRLLRVLNKLAYLWPQFKVLMKAIIHTGISLNYWLVLFALMLYIFTLMSQEFFARQFYFKNTDNFAEAAYTDEQYDQGVKLVCPASPDNPEDPYWCVPRAHFDTFLWALVTVFQVMTGENWNTIMYASMRASGPHAALFFVLLILFGQTLVLSLFLTMVMSKFDEVQDLLEEEEKIKIQKRKMAKQAKKQKLMKALTKSDAGSQGGRAGGSRSGSLGEVEKMVEEAERERENAANAGEESEPKPAESQDGTKLEHSLTATSAEALPGRPAPEPPSETPLEAIDSQNLEDIRRPSTIGSETDERRASRTSSQIFFGPAQKLIRQATEPVLARPGWPNGYALFILHEDNPFRKFCEEVLTRQAVIFGTKVKVFDNFILLCILLASVCMAVDYPLRDPNDPLTKMVRQADFVFAIIFIFEMGFKLCARGLVWGPQAYLKSGWNWLDGIVVIVSIVGMAGIGNSGSLKTLRILRAFRPLRVISRNENLKVVVQTIFSSMPDLFTLVIVSILFLLIFALMALSYLSGRLQACSDPAGLRLLQEPLEDFVTPLCLRPKPWVDLDVDDSYTACTRGSPGGTPGVWTSASDCSGCGGGRTLEWQRASADTPMCVGRCDPMADGDAPGPHDDLCPKAANYMYMTDQVPSACSDYGSPEYEARVTAEFGAAFYESEVNGTRYKDKHLRSLVMPCGGYTVENGVSVKPPGVMSCKEAFCPNGVSAERTETCRDNCQDHPFFCYETCKDGDSEFCKACREECQAQCECAEFCGEGLIKDGALCTEQGQTWSESLSQNFNNIQEAMLTLFEISTTEGWVDVMYAATDSKGYYMQPKRDTEVLWAVYFMVYIFFFFMFIINLSVGVIVDKFMDLKAEASTTLADDVDAGTDLIHVMAQAGFSQDAEITIENQGLGLSETSKIKQMKGVGKFQLVARLENSFPAGTTVTKKGQQIMSTEEQDKWKKKWLNARKSLDGKQNVYILTNLQNLAPNRRKVYDLVSSRMFENSIMAAILLNTAIMCLKIFPAPTDDWDSNLQAVNYIFAAIFTIEAVVKLFALRWQYFRDYWNLFDFGCVIATLFGIIITQISSGANFAAITSVIRIFRIARLFRLLRFLKGLNKIFMALLLSLPKLANVFMILVLMLILYSILGVNLFSMMKQGDTFNHHGSFRHFLWAFVTLFRASTGEAWNEVMHDLMKDERSFYRSGTWCTKASLFDPEDVTGFKKLQSKCLIESPNSCSGGPGPAFLPPVIFWVSYTLLITFMIMNLVIAVILEGYEDGKPTEEGEAIERCVLIWRKYDPNQTMNLELHRAMEFIFEVARLKDVVPQGRGPTSTKSLEKGTSSVSAIVSTTSLKEFATIPMKYAKQLDLQPDESNMVSFRQAAQQAIRLACFSDKDEATKAVDAAEMKNQKENMFELREDIAARKVQQVFRDRKVRPGAPVDSTLSEGASGVPARAAEDPAALHVESAGSTTSIQVQLDQRPPNPPCPKDGDDTVELRQAGQGNSRDPPDASEVHLTPPRAG